MYRSAAPSQQAGPLGLQRAHDVLKVADGARQPIDPRDDQLVAVMDELENGLEFLAPGGGRAAHLLRPDDIASGRLERLGLDIEVLVDGAHPRIADPAYGRPDCLVWA
jgi:hypothetical protein